MLPQNEISFEEYKQIIAEFYPKQREWETWFSYKMYLALENNDLESFDKIQYDYEYNWAMFKTGDLN